MSRPIVAGCSAAGPTGNQVDRLARPGTQASRPYCTSGRVGNSTTTRASCGLAFGLVTVNRKVPRDSVTEVRNPVGYTPWRRRGWVPSWPRATAAARRATTSVVHHDRVDSSPGTRSPAGTSAVEQRRALRFGALCASGRPTLASSGTNQLYRQRLPTDRKPARSFRALIGPHQLRLFQDVPLHCLFEFGFCRLGEAREGGIQGIELEIVTVSADGRAGAAV